MAIGILRRGFASNTAKICDAITVMRCIFEISRLLACRVWGKGLITLFVGKITFLCIPPISMSTRPNTPIVFNTGGSPSKSVFCRLLLCAENNRALCQIERSHGYLRRPIKHIGLDAISRPGSSRAIALLLREIWAVVKPVLYRVFARV